MQIVFTWQGIITASAVVGAVITLLGLCAQGIRWFDRQNAQDQEIQNLKDHHKKDVAEIKEEQTLMVYGVLACLKGLKEQGCNGPVTEAINKLEKHLNQKAHQ